MKYMIRIQVSVEAGKVIDELPGGPGPFVKRLVDRFKPESVYISPSHRELFLVAELGPADVAELMIAGATYSGNYPEFVPVVTVDEFPAIVAKALPAALKLVRG